MFGRDKQKKLEIRRKDVLLAIRDEQLSFDEMVQRAQISREPPNNPVLTSAPQRLRDFEQKASQATDIDELDELEVDARRQGNFRAYLCPCAEILDEGSLAIDLMEEWNVPKTVLTKLRTLLVRRLEQADADIDAARGALRTIFQERDSWESYTDEYEETMRGYTLWLFLATIILPPLAIFAFRFPPTVLTGLLFAGAAGSCASVMARMPLLDVSLSGELESYGRRIWSRLGIGVIASVIGCALLGWGILPISIQNQSFADALISCTGYPATSCTSVKTLILLGVPMLFGFSERGLTSFEQRVFGNAGQGRGTRTPLRQQ
jgi:hypothetical protein